MKNAPLKFLVVMSGLSALALASGCGGKAAEKIEPVLSAAKAEARAACGDHLDCKSGVVEGAHMARKVLPRFLSIREEGGERIYEGHVFSLKRYRQGMQGKFAGIESYCDAALTVPPGVTSETPHYPTEEQVEACARGAEKFFVALGKIACGTEIEKLGESESRLCELHREAVVAETTQPASFGGYDCPVAGGRQCP